MAVRAFLRFMADFFVMAGAARPNSFIYCFLEANAAMGVIQARYQATKVGMSQVPDKIKQLMHRNLPRTMPSARLTRVSRWLFVENRPRTSVPCDAPGLILLFTLNQYR